MFRTVTARAAARSSSSAVKASRSPLVAQRFFSGDKAAPAQAVEDSHIQKTASPSFIGMNGMGAAPGAAQRQPFSRELSDTRALKPELINQLPKTFQKFALTNKVAVITG